MKKKILLILLVIAMIISCKSTGTKTNTKVKPGNISSFSDVMGKEWKLVEIQVDGTSSSRIALYDRNDLTKNNIASIYTLKFDDEMIGGTGAPNKYSAPYTKGEDNALTIQVIRSTQMAPIVQPEKLQEFVFYTYMQSVEKWSSENGNLILHSKTKEGNDVRLIFVQ